MTAVAAVRRALAPAAHGWEETDDGVFGDALDDAEGGLLVVDEDSDRGVHAAFEYEAVTNARALFFEEFEDASHAAATGEIELDLLAVVAEDSEGGGNVDGDHGEIRVQSADRRSYGADGHEEGIGRL